MLIVCADYRGCPQQQVHRRDTAAELSQACNEEWLYNNIGINTTQSKGLQTDIILLAICLYKMASLIGTFLR